MYFLSCDACRLLFVHLYCNCFKVTAPVFDKSLVLKEINVTFLYSLLTQCKKVQVIVYCLSVCLSLILPEYDYHTPWHLSKQLHPHWHCYRCSARNITKWNIYGIYLNNCFDEVMLNVLRCQLVVLGDS